MSAIGDYIHLTYEGYAERRGAQREPYQRGAKEVGTIIKNRERQFNN